MANPLESYQDFVKEFHRDRLSESVTNKTREIFAESLDHLGRLVKIELRSKVEGKKYFSFEQAGKLSRPVNLELFQESHEGIAAFLGAISRGDARVLTPDQITRACYTIAISFSCIIDLEKKGDQKTPGTFFEYFICHLVARTLGVNPQTKIEVLNLDRPASLPTDWIFDLGVDQPKIHLPVKTSTRERAIQVWAHQRILDGAYGVDRFLGVLICLAETKLDHSKREVVEICLPGQWRLYQSFIARMKRIYYLDLPGAYASLNQDFPGIEVKTFGHFFHELDRLRARDGP